MSTTANTLIRRAMSLLGKLGQGQGATPGEYADGLLALNDMVAAWALEPLTIYTQSRTTKVLTASTQTYTIGTSATISVARPLWIANAGIVPASSTMEIPIDVLSDDDWAHTAIKAQTSTFPTAVWYDYGFDSSGYGTITVWPIPTTAPTLVLYLPTAISTFANGTTTYLFPPGYERALRFNLALELAAEYGQEPPPVVVQTAMSSKAMIKRSNNRMAQLAVDTALLPEASRGRSYNWRTDQ